MISLTAFVRDLFCLANAHLAAGEAGDGRGFRAPRRAAPRGDRRATGRGLLRRPLAGQPFPLGPLPPDRRHRPHAGGGRDRRVEGVPRLRSPRTTCCGSRPRRTTTGSVSIQYATAPVIRVFGGTGYASPALRRYAALWGICLITADRWPAPLLAAETTVWPRRRAGPPRAPLPRLAGRPLSMVCVPQRDGAGRSPSRRRMRRSTTSSPPRPLVGRSCGAASTCAPAASTSG